MSDRIVQGDLVDASVGVAAGALGGGVIGLLKENYTGSQERIAQSLTESSKETGKSLVHLTDLNNTYKASLPEMESIAKEMKGQPESAPKFAALVDALEKASPEFKTDYLKSLNDHGADSAPRALRALAHQQNLAIEHTNAALAGAGWLPTGHEPLPVKHGRTLGGGLNAIYPFSEWSLSPRSVDAAIKFAAEGNKPYGEAEIRQTMHDFGIKQRTPLQDLGHTTWNNTGRPSVKYALAGAAALGASSYVLGLDNIIKGAKAILK